MALYVFVSDILCERCLGYMALYVFVSDILCERCLGYMALYVFVVAIFFCMTGKVNCFRWHAGHIQSK